MNYHLKKVGGEPLNETVLFLYGVGARIYGEVIRDKTQFFAVDGSARTNIHTKVNLVAGRETLTYKPQPHQAASNADTDLIIGIAVLSKQNDAGKLLGTLPQVSIVSLDHAYYTKDNIEDSEEKELRYHIRFKKWRGQTTKGRCSDDVGRCLTLKSTAGGSWVRVPSPTWRREPAE